MTGSISSTGGGFDISALKQMQEKMFKAMDSNNDGKVDKSEMTAFQETQKSNGRQGGPSVDEIFKKQDANDDGVISMQEAEASIAKLAQEMQNQETSGSDPREQMKKAFDDLGSALSSGSLDDAKAAFATLQENAPNDDNTPSEITDLKNALDSGDLQAAQQAYSQIKQKMSQGPPAGGAPPPGGQPVAAQGGAQGSEESSSSTSTTYDKMDANKDGTVSAQEEFTYKLKHPGEEDTSKQSTSAPSSKDKQATSLEKYA